MFQQLHINKNKNVYIYVCVCILNFSKKIRKNTSQKHEYFFNESIRRFKN